MNTQISGRIRSRIPMLVKSLNSTLSMNYKLKALKSMSLNKLKLTKKSKMSLTVFTMLSGLILKTKSSYSKEYKKMNKSKEGQCYGNRIWNSL